MDAYDTYDRNERANERANDLNRETAAECDGISPVNIPVWSALRVENMDGTTNVNATVNALCAHVTRLNEVGEVWRTDLLRLETESEAVADEIRAMAADRDAIADVAAQYAIENERLRERVTNAETMLRSIREDWDRTSTGMTRLGLDLILGNPEAREMKEAA